MASPLRIALIGIGDIAERVYLPLLSGRGDLELVLVTRDPAKLDRIARQHQAAACHTSLAAAIEHGLDAGLVHAATEAHPPLVRQLLEADVPVYVDKPLADSLVEAERLVALADSRRVCLMTGFNRRFAPLYAELRSHPRDLLLMQKHRSGLADTPRRVIFDDFIHVIDTLRFLQPGPARRIEVASKLKDGLLQHVLLQLFGDGWAATGVMSRVSGGSEEVVEALGDNRKRRVVNLSDVVDYEGGSEVLRRRADWSSAARQRGIEQAVEHFLEAVRAGRRLQAHDALETHRLCEQVLAEALS